MKKFFLLSAALLLSLCLGLEASAYEFNGKRFFKCSTCSTAYPTYAWGDNMSGPSVLKSGWQSGISDWNGKQSKVEFIYASNSNSKLHSYSNKDKSLYGEMVAPTDILGFVTKFDGYINVNAENISTNNVARSVAGHELGHAMGLDHNSGTSIMNSKRVRSQLYEPQKDDVNGINARY
ncbi:matrixin family metalloprotease [Lysinibacillus xylanilyticus]|uniref:matrixin family metalloprotease n=1 Tax=Lysinibacillus xylanilyticus TaxID=582475 RepID=UPI00382B8D85